MLVYVSIGAFELQCENIGAFELKCENIGSYEQQRENRRNECQGLATNGKHDLTMSVLREHSASRSSIESQNTHEYVATARTPIALNQSAIFCLQFLPSSLII